MLKFHTEIKFHPNYIIILIIFWARCHFRPDARDVRVTSLTTLPVRLWTVMAGGRKERTKGQFIISNQTDTKIEEQEDIGLNAERYGPLTLSFLDSGVGSNVNL